MRLSLAMIVKDEEQSLPRLFDSVAKHVDEIVVVDTGSTDNTKQVAESYGAQVYDFEWVDDFSAARNFSFSKATGDWILWLDADDEVENAKKLKEICELASDHVSAIHLPYYYDVDENGFVLTKQDRERLIRNNDSFEWKGRLHETLIPKRRVGRNKNEEVIIWHCADNERRDASLERNIRILENMAQEEHETGNTDPRTCFYLGTCYADTGDYERSIGMLQVYLKMSGWPEERSQAWCLIGNMRYEQDQTQEARVAFLMGLGEYPENPEPYVGLAKLAVTREKYDEAKPWLEMAKEKPEPERLSFQNTLVYEYELPVLYAETLLMTGDPKNAIKWLKKAQKIRNDEYTRERMDIYRKVYKHEKKCQQIFEQLKKYEKNKDYKKIRKTLRELPDEVNDNPALVKWKRRYLPAQTWPEKSVVFFTGSSVEEEWGPWSLGEGIGGSEEAVIRLSNRLVEQGYTVTVYACPGAGAGVHNGVEWRNYWEIDLRDKFDVFIGWRSPWTFDATINARKKYLWMHDVMEKEEFTQERLDNLDKVMVLSQYHRNLYPDVPDDKIMISANGIDVDEFEQIDELVQEGELTRDPYRMIYQSSHVRGLEHLYDIWPDIKKEVSEAKLRIMYGWDSYIAVNKDNPERMEWMEHMKNREKELEDVEDLGKVSHPQVMNEIAKAGIWAYPCHFPEVSCITAMKAQAGGAIPVTTNYAALEETVQHGEKVSVSEEFTHQDVDNYKQALISWLKDPDRQAEHRQAMIDDARQRFSWSKVAEDWIAEFEA